MDATEGQGSPTDTHCFDVKGIGLDAAFIGALSDTALSATMMTREDFDSRFPGWELYRTVVAGDEIFLPKLRAYAVGMARAVSRARKINRHPVVREGLRHNVWIRQAGLDALYIAIHGKVPMNSSDRAEGFGIPANVYKRLRDSVAGGMIIGLEKYRQMLFDNYLRARALDRRFVV